MYETGKLVELNINDILPNRFQPRIYFNEPKLIQLSESIHKYGVIQPIVVRQINNKYEIIAGERRYKASKLANKATIPAIIVNLSDRESEEIALLENIQRQELTPIEEAVSYKRILDMGYITQESLAKKIGKSQSTIANKIRLLNLDDTVQEALLYGKISERHARSLLKITNRSMQREMLHRIINERLTVKRTDEEIAELLNNSSNESNDASQKQLQNIQNNIEQKEVVENLFEDNLNYNNRKEGFMDIDKIMREAKDINVENKPNDVSKFMFNQTVPNQEPNQNVQMNPQVISNPNPQTSPVDENKFVHYVPQEPETLKTVNPQTSSNFNNIFNPSPSDLMQTNSLSMPSNEQNIQNNANSNIMQNQEQPNIIKPDESNMPKYQEFTSKPNNVENSYNEISPSTISNNNQNTVNEHSSIASAVSAAFDAVSNNQNARIEQPTQNYVQPNQNINNQNPYNISNQTSVMPSAEPSIPSTNYSNINPQSTNISNIPTGDIFEDTVPSSSNVQPSMMNMPNKTVNIPGNNLKDVIHLIRECADKIENLGFVINVDEIDLDDNYQVTFKIDKQ